MIFKENVSIINWRIYCFGFQIFPELPFWVAENKVTMQQVKNVITIQDGEPPKFLVKRTDSNVFCYKRRQRNRESENEREQNYV